MVRCHANSAVSTIPYEVLCKENAVLQKRQYPTTASRDGFPFVRAWFWSWRRVSAALDKFKESEVCLSPPERDDVIGRFTVTHTCAWIMKSTSPALHTNSSHSSPGVCCPSFGWIDLARTSQRENPVGGVHCPANPVLNNERESTVKKTILEFVHSLDHGCIKIHRLMKRRDGDKWK